MSITIDKAGRVVIPQAIRRRLGLDAGTNLDVEEIDGIVVLRPVSSVRMEIADDGKPILRAPEGTAAMTTENLLAMIDDLRAWPRR